MTPPNEAPRAALPTLAARLTRERARIPRPMLLAATQRDQRVPGDDPRVVVRIEGELSVAVLDGDEDQPPLRMEAARAHGFAVERAARPDELLLHSQVGVLEDRVTLTN